MTRNISSQSSAGSSNSPSPGGELPWTPDFKGPLQHPPIARTTSWCARSEPFDYISEDEADDIDDDLDDGHEGNNNNTLETGQMNLMMVILTFLTSVCGFLFGYDTGYISGALVVIGNDLGDTPLTSGNKELITSATSLGALVAACLGGVLADQFGRKWVISFANVLFIAGAGMQAGAHTLWTMVGGRFVMGWGVGLASLVAPLYISEMAPSRFRGRLVVINVLAITGGQLVAYSISVGLSHVNNGWRILVGLSMIPAAMQMVVFIFMPDTPRYLVSRGRVETARRVLSQVYGKVCREQEIEDKLEELIKYNLGQDSYVDGRGTFEQGFEQNGNGNGRGGVGVGVEDSMDENTARRATNNAPNKRNIRGRLRRWGFRTLAPYYEVLSVGANFRAVVITCGLQGIQQFSGFNSLMYFSGTIFESVGFEDPTTVSLIVAGTNFVFTIVAFMAIDKIGRRRILLWTIPGMAVGLVINAIAFHFLKFTISKSGGLVGDASNKDSRWAGVVIFAMLFYVAFYAVGTGNVPWQQSEMFPTRVRGAGTSLATATNWAGSLVISSTFLTMLRNITPTGTFALFAGLCVTGVIFVYFVYPETAGLTLEEVTGLLATGFNVKESERLSRERTAEISAREEDGE
ncbi:uncharacterized protein SAPINGB_P004444 [Magnusiomyces paraingens]|uniref:Major facilitator superfamily (MFS) profile domain-containing protein n=1 Tax=Magnusiomyces paraingens TaxID=2606893 RepID=A0A5E8BWR6_9ASCO|nr:uncharacterized protein SAPINGB_P004444 [Saprochaete ingens]VVT55134.1 unnamed protein product [Saprochaete ingens]